MPPNLKQWDTRSTKVNRAVMIRSEVPLLCYERVDGHALHVSDPIIDRLALTKWRRMDNRASIQVIVFVVFGSLGGDFGGYALVRQLIHPYAIRN